MDDNIAKTIGARIKSKREEIGISQKALAEMVGTSPAAINQFEKDRAVSLNAIGLAERFQRALQQGREAAVFREQPFGERLDILLRDRVRQQKLQQGFLRAGTFLSARKAIPQPLSMTFGLRIGHHYHDQSFIALGLSWVFLRPSQSPPTCPLRPCGISKGGLPGGRASA